MTFQFAVDDIKRINSFLAADTYFQQTAKVRGHKDDYRPLRLSRRDHKYKQLTKHGEGDATYYAARCYSTDLVEFHRDHMILNVTTHWRSATTIAFMNAVMPRWIDIATHKDMFWVRINGGNWVVPDPSRKLKIMVDPINGYRPVPQHIQTMKVEMRRVDRKAANALYKPMKDYFQWAHMMFEMEAAEQIVAIELDYPLFTHEHKELDADGDPVRRFWNVQRDYSANASGKLQELVSGEVNPETFGKILTLSLCCSRSFSSWRSYRNSSHLFGIDGSAKANKVWLQKFIVDMADAYKWEVRPNDRSFPSQTIRVDVSEQIRIGE